MWDSPLCCCRVCASLLCGLLARHLGAAAQVCSIILCGRRTCQQCMKHSTKESDCCYCSASSTRRAPPPSQTHCSAPPQPPLTCQEACCCQQAQAQKQLSPLHGCAVGEQQESKNLIWWRNHLSVGGSLAAKPKKVGQPPRGKMRVVGWPAALANVRQLSGTIQRGGFGHRVLVGSIRYSPPPPPYPPHPASVQACLGTSSCAPSVSETQSEARSRPGSRKTQNRRSSTQPCGEHHYLE